MGHAWVTEDVQIKPFIVEIFTYKKHSIHGNVKLNMPFKFLTIFCIFSGVTEDTGDTDQGTDVDKVHINNGFKMDVESPSSEELEHLGSQTDETDDSDSDLNSQSYTIQKGDATQRFKDENRAKSASPITEATDPTSDAGKSHESSDNIENKEPVEKKPRKDKKVSELSTPEKRLSSDASKFMDVNLSGSRPGSAASSAKSGSGREKGNRTKILA